MDPVTARRGIHDEHHFPIGLDHRPLGGGREIVGPGLAEFAGFVGVIDERAPVRGEDVDIISDIAFMLGDEPRFAAPVVSI